MARRAVRPTCGVLDVGQTPVSELDLASRARRAVVLALLAYGPRAVAVGPSALVLHGVWGIPPETAPTIALPGRCSRRPRDGIRVRRFGVDERIVDVDGFRTVEPVLALAQSVVEMSPRAALAVLDSAMNRGVIDAAGLVEVERTTRRRRGCRRIAGVWGMVDGRRESPPESWAWFDLTAAGLRPTDVQVTICDAQGDFLARGDLGYELADGQWLLLEINGRAYHQEWSSVVNDHHRQNGLTMTGRVQTVTYFASDLGASGLMVRQVGTYLAGRTWRRPTG